MSDTSSSDTTFRDLKLPASLLATLDEVGYETPTPIQAQAIPHLLEGLDLLGHAPTGSGKTAAFALPLLARLEIDRLQVQIMVLTPTRDETHESTEQEEQTSRREDEIRGAAHLQHFEAAKEENGHDHRPTQQDRNKEP